MTMPVNESTPDLSVIGPQSPVPAPSPALDDQLPGAPLTTAPSPKPASAPPDLADETRRRRSERNSRDLLIEVSSELTRRVRHPDGGDSPVEEIAAHERAQRDEIDREAALGSRKHHRLARWMHSIPRYVLGFDFGLLLYFFSGITNVNWSNPISGDLAFAVVLAGMVTVLSYGFLAFTGNRLRSHKNHAGTIHGEDVDAITGATFLIAVVVIAVLAALMFLRIRTEVLYALGGQAQDTALVIAVVVSVVNAVANFLVVAIHALDGSDQTARLDKLSAAIRRPLARAHQLRARAARQVNL